MSNKNMPGLLLHLAGIAGANITGPLGKGRDTSWRNSRHFLSRHARANKRKAARRAK